MSRVVEVAHGAYSLAYLVLVFLNGKSYMEIIKLKEKIINYRLNIAESCTILIK